jgi:hypothetical protein
MRPTFAFLATLLLATVAAAQQDMSTGLAQQVTALAARLQQQQAQIEALQKSQQGLLDELRAARSASATPAAAVATTQLASSSAPAAPPPTTTQPQSSAPAETPSTTRAGRYVDWQSAQPKLSLAGDRVRLGGYGSVRFETNDVQNGNNIPGGSAAGFTFRRFVITTDARPASRLRIYSELELERLFNLEAEKGFTRSPGGLGFKQTLEGNNNGEIALEQAWGQYNFADNHGLRMGIVLAPVGRFNLLHDDDYWDIPRRTLTDRDAPVLPVKSAWRDLGAGLVGSFNLGKTGKLDYQAYVLNGAALDFNIEQEVSTEAGAPGSAELVLNSELQLTSGVFDGTKSANALAWRLAYSPSLNGELAFSGYRGKYAPPFLSFREPVTSIAYDHKWRWKAFETEAEAVYTNLGRLERVLDAFAAGAFNSASATLPGAGEGGLTSAVVEMELANLSRTRVGFWSDFKYHARPKWLKDSFLGHAFEDPQLIPIVRYERVWLNGVTDDIAVSNGVVAGFTQEDLEQERVTAGISYRPNLQFAIQAAFEHNRRINGSRLIFPEVDQDSTNGFLLGMAFSF